MVQAAGNSMAHRHAEFREHAIDPLRHSSRIA
jgi:hypothetical protein